MARMPFVNLRQILLANNKILNSISQSQETHIKFLPDETIINGIDENRIYISSPTGKIFHEDNSFVKLIMGPYGSGKSTMLMNEIVKKACEMPYWYHGRRRSRWIIIRNTSGELYSTTLKTWVTWFEGLGSIKKRQKPILTYEHMFNDGNGVVELEVLFLALDREDDVRKLKSLEATGAYINELSEIPQSVLPHLKGRVNHRYPPIAFCRDDYQCGIIADTNPPADDHWIHNLFEIEHLDSHRLFKQPPGLIKNEDNKWIENPDCDNRKNMAGDYYTKLAQGQTEGFIKVFCLGHYGIVSIGKRVYTEYNDDVHSVDDIVAIQGESIHLGWDFGLTPACVVVQFSANGQLRILKEYTTKDMGIKNFAESIVIPSLRRDFPYCKIGISRDDPAGSKRDEIMEELSCNGILNKLGITTEGAYSNEIDTRLNGVRFFLNRMSNGNPGLLLSRKGCPILRDGFIKSYCFKRVNIKNEDRYRDIPDKNFASHPHDALQYVTMDFASDCLMKNNYENKKVDMYNPVMRIFN